MTFLKKTILTTIVWQRRDQIHPYDNIDITVKPVFCWNNHERDFPFGESEPEENTDGDYLEMKSLCEVFTVGELSFPSQ